MIKFLLWCILLVICWPLALIAVIAYPLVWILLLPFRLVGIAVDGVFELLRGIVMLPVRLVAATGPDPPGFLPLHRTVSGSACQIDGYS